MSLKGLQPCAVSAQNIEQMKGKFRTHRAAFDFDRSFCSIDAAICKVDDTKATTGKKERIK